MSGWICDYRKELESDIWLLPPMYHRVWQWIKYSVNHKQAKIPNKDGTFTVINPGQRATSYRQIAKGVGYYEGVKWKEPNPKTVKTILNWLESQGMITVEGNSRGTIITIVNWALYQEKTVKGNAQVTPKKHSLDTNNNENNEKQKKILEHFEKCWKLYPVKKGKDKITLTDKKELFKFSYEVIEKAIKLGSFKSKKAAIEAGLKLIIQIKSQEKLRELRGKLKWEGNLDTMRIDK